MIELGGGPARIAVARDRLVFAMSEITGNIWMTNREGQR